jgi:hypothetical protein
MCFLLVCIAKEWFGRVVVRLSSRKGGHGQRRHLALVSRHGSQREKAKLPRMGGVKGTMSVHEQTRRAALRGWGKGGADAGILRRAGLGTG